MGKTESEFISLPVELNAVPWTVAAEGILSRRRQLMVKRKLH
jgi:hypothetical protein